jgi:hypothetical protein
LVRSEVLFLIFSTSDLSALVLSNSSKLVTFVFSLETLFFTSATSVLSALVFNKVSRLFTLVLIYPTSVLVA